MATLFYISLAIALCYVALIMAFAIGWKRTPIYNPSETEKCETFVSVIVCCRDEAENLPTLLKSLDQQSYPHIEFVFANDHSSDNTASLLTAFKETHHYHSVQIRNPQTTGKKNALHDAVEHSSGSLIFCTDADCILNQNHIKTLASFYLATKADLILGPVEMAPQENLFEKLQVLEFLSLIISGGGATGLHKPILCNGANIAFTRQSWEQSKHYLHEQTPSGDDQFMLFQLKKQGANIQFIKAKETIVKTHPCRTLSDFFNQRARWTSKNTQCTDTQTIMVAILVFAYTLILLFWLSATLVAPQNGLAFGLFFLLKFLADTFLLLFATPFFGMRKLCWYTPILSLIYPLYVAVTAIKAFLGHFQWKNRTF